MNQSAAVVVFLLLVSITSFGYQTTRVPEYFTSNYTDESGLPQNSIRKIVADSIGFIWLATEGGLVRYDGRTFKVFNRATLGIESERIPTFKRNPSNQNLYAIAEGTQLIKIRGGRAFKETTYNTVRSLDRSFLLPIQKQSGDHFEIPDVIAQNKINYQVILGKAPQYYLYKDQKVFFCQQGRLQTSVKFPGRMSFDIPPLQWSQEMGRIMLGESNNVYNFIDIDGHLFYHIGGHGQNFLHVQPNPSSTDNRLPLSGDITQNLDFRSSPDQVTVINNPFNSQTFAYLGRHFYIINYIDGKLNTRLIMKDVDFEKNNIVSAYYNANNGIVFLGSTTKGLFIHTPKYFNILSYDAKWDNNVFYSHLPYGNSSVITPQGYIGDLLNPTKKTTPVTRDKERSSKLTMLRDRDKNLWMVKLGPQNFIQKFGPDAGNVIGSWLINDGPTKLYQGNGAGIWIGTLSGQLYYLPQAGNTSSSIEKVARIANAEITWLYQDNNTSILVGTTNGLFRFLPNSKKVIPVAGFENLNIRSVFASDPGRLWVTTYGSGIFLMEGSKVHKLPLDQGRCLDYAHCIQEDSLGNFWMTTNRGLFQAKKQDLIDYATTARNHVLYLHYDKRNGFNTNEFNGACEPCGNMLPNGLVTFPSLNGLVWFKPSMIRPPALTSQFIIEDITLDGKSIPPGDTLDLPFDFKHLDFSPITPFFGNKNNLRFIYQLQKINSGDATWAEMRRSISIYNIAAGNYSLTIRKISGFGGAYVEKKIFLTIGTPWYFRPWFILLSVASFFLLLFGLIKWRTAYLIRQNQILAKKVEERTQDLTTAVEDLETSDEKLRQQLNRQTHLIGVISHDLRTPLRHLSRNSKKLHEKIESIHPDFEQLFLSKSIAESIDKVYGLSEDLLTFIKTTIRQQGEIGFEPVDIEAILQEKSQLFAAIAQENQTKIVLQAQQGLQITSNKRMLEIVIHNLLDNAIKSTLGDTVLLTSEKQAQKALISIIDSGGGMPDEIAKWLSEDGEMNIVDSSDEALPKNMGLGLIVVKEMTRLLGISLTVHTSNAGTRIQLLAGNSI